MICKEIINILEQNSPKRYACDWDNTGLLAGSAKQNVNTVYIALDATGETIEEAKEAGADLILTHHPIVFRGLKKITADDYTGRRIIELIKNNMACYAMHTNFDVSTMAKLAADRLKLKEPSVLQPTCMEEDGPEGIGRIGRLPKKMTLRACAEWTKQVFQLDAVRVFGDLERTVESAAVCPGSGKSVIEDGLRMGAQVLITGDIDHHEGIDAAAMGMSIIDAGHYGLEQIFIPYMKQYLEERLQEVKVCAQPPKKPFVFI